MGCTGPQLLFNFILYFIERLTKHNNKNNNNNLFFLVLCLAVTLQCILYQIHILHVVFNHLFYCYSFSTMIKITPVKLAVLI